MSSLSGNNGGSDGHNPGDPHDSFNAGASIPPTYQPAGNDQNEFRSIPESREWLHSERLSLAVLGNDLAGRISNRIIDQTQRTGIQSFNNLLDRHNARAAEFGCDPLQIPGLGNWDGAHPAQARAPVPVAGEASHGHPVQQGQPATELPDGDDMDPHQAEDATMTDETDDHTSVVDGDLDEASWYSYSEANFNLVKSMFQPGVFKARKLGKRYRCEERRCHAKFDTEEGLTNHWRDTHNSADDLTKDQSLRCSICRKYYDKQVSLQRHMQIHDPFSAVQLRLEPLAVPLLCLCMASFDCKKKLSDHVTTAKFRAKKKEGTAFKIENFGHRLVDDSEDAE